MKLIPLTLFLLYSIVRSLGAADQPNILMIAIDDQNDWIGSVSYTHLTLPTKA